MSTPNFCPNCGEDLREYQEGKKESSSENGDSESKPTREDYRRILNEELEKAEAPEFSENKESDDSENNLTREDYEEVLERKLKEAKEEKNSTEVPDVDPEVKQAVETLANADREAIEQMREGYPKKMAKDIKDIADGKEDNLRLLGG